jgi:phosphopantothenoylcysteine decarboxylase / phosphopantothenate---cysteine ligase
MARILLGVSGGIAAYKALHFIRLATDAGHAVRVIQTPTSLRFVGKASFEAITGAPVLVDEFEHDPARGAFPGQEPPPHQPLSHLQLVENAGLYLVAPASANTLAKLAQGVADNLLCSAALAAACPVLVAPAMNNRMWEHPATQANLALLRKRGVRVVDPDAGRLASVGEQGVGRLAEPARLLQECERILAAAAAAGQAWRDMRVLVTAGGTREPIDSVRFVGNSSSGRMGIALAERAARRGAEVTLIAANVSLPGPVGVDVVRVGTAAELQAACEQRFEACDVLLMAAAVADFRPADPADGKIKKGGRDCLQIDLEPTADVLKGLAQRRRAEQTLVGFAAEHGPEAIELARGKLSGKRLDALVVNDISRADIGFESDDNEVAILTHEDERRVAKASKAQVADAILDAVERLRTGG